MAGLYDWYTTAKKKLEDGLGEAGNAYNQAAGAVGGAFNAGVSNLGGMYNQANNNLYQAPQAIKDTLNSPAPQWTQPVTQVSDNLFGKATDALANTPQATFADDMSWQNPVGKLEATAVEGVINMVPIIFKSYGNTVKSATNLDVNSGKSWKNLAGNVSELGLNMAAPFVGGGATKNVVRSGIAGDIFKGAVSAAKPMGAFGAGYGLADSLKNDASAQDTAVNTAISGGAGAVLGGVLGGGMAAVGAGTRALVRDLPKIKNDLFNLPKSARTVTTPVTKETIPAHYVKAGEQPGIVQGLPGEIRTALFPKPAAGEQYGAVRPTFRDTAYQTPGVTRDVMAPVPAQTVTRGGTTVKPFEPTSGLFQWMKKPVLGNSIEDVSRIPTNKNTQEINAINEAKNAKARAELDAMMNARKTQMTGQGEAKPAPVAPMPQPEVKVPQGVNQAGNTSTPAAPRVDSAEAFRKSLDETPPPAQPKAPTIDEYMTLPSEQKQNFSRTGKTKASDPFNPQPVQYNRWQQKAYDDKAGRMKSIKDILGIPREVVTIYGKKDAEKMTADQARTVASLLRLGYPKEVINSLESGKAKMMVENNVKFRPKPNLNTPEQQPKNKVPLTINGNTEQERVQSAIVNSERIKNEIVTRGQDALLKGRALSPEDLALAGKYEHGRPIDELAQEAKNPTAFKSFMNSLTDYYDFQLAADRAAGGQTPLRAFYLRHEWDLSNPADLSRFNEVAKQRGISQYNGYSSQPRVFNTYAEGEALGFRRKNPNILGDLQSSFMGASDAISRQTLKRGLNLAAPGKVSTTGMGKTEDGTPFINSNIRGLEGMSFHPSVNDQLNGFQPKTNKDFIAMAQREGRQQGGGVVNTLKNVPSSAKEAGFSGIIGTLYDHASQPMKHFLLNGSLFHSLNVSFNYAAASLMHPIKGIRGLAESVPAFFSENATQYFENGFKKKIIPGRDYSVFDAGLRAGVNMGRELPVSGVTKLSSVGETVKKFNPLDASSRAIFGRELHILKVNLVDQVFGNGQIDPASPKGIALGKEINMIMGDMNNRTMNINPNTQKWLSRALLAPSFLESQLKLISDAATHWDKNSAGNLARTAVLGKSLVVGTLATMGTLLATGKFPSLQQVLMNYTLDPETQTNITSPSGTKQEIAWPKTNLSLASGLVTDPVHFGISRLAPALSDAVSGITNQDYYGNPIIDPNSTKPVSEQVTKNLVLGDLPIGVQNLVKFGEGKQNLAQTAINIGGLRAHTDPTDPTMVYFKTLDDAKAGLTNPNDIAAWNIIHPVNKTTGGEYIIHPTVWDSVEKATTYLSHPNVLTADNNMNRVLAQSGQTVDPFFTSLTPDQQQVMLTYATLPPQDPQKTNIAKNNPWMSAINNSRAAFFDTLPAANPDKPKSPIQYPQPSPAVEDLQNQYYQITDPKERADFINKNPTLLDQFAAAEQYSRAIRTARNLPLYDAYPEAAPELRKAMDTYSALPKGTGDRSAWIRNNQDTWNKMSTYWAQTALYNLERSAGQAEFQNNGFDQKGLKAINSLGTYDIGKSTDANGNTIYSLSPGAGNGGGFGFKPADPLNKAVTLSEAKLTNAERKGDYSTWKLEANQQASNLQSIMSDPNKTEAQRTQAENKLLALQSQAATYARQGGFKYIKQTDTTALDMALIRAHSPSSSRPGSIAAQIFHGRPMHKATRSRSRMLALNMR